MTLTPAEVERLLTLARHERADVATRACEVLADVAYTLRNSDDADAFVEFMAQVWRGEDYELAAWVWEWAFTT